MFFPKFLFITIITVPNFVTGKKKDECLRLVEFFKGTFLHVMVTNTVKMIQVRLSIQIDIRP